METSYTVKESKHTSLLEDGFIPVETALEVPVQEQFVKTNVMHINSIDFEKIVAVAGTLIKPIDFTKKFKIVLDYDPEQSKVKLEYFKSEEYEKEKLNLEIGKKEYLNKLKESNCSSAYDAVVILSKYSQDEVIRLNHSMLEFLANIKEKQIEISYLKDISKAIIENLDQVDEFDIKVLSELIENYKKQKITANEISRIYNISFAIIMQKELFNFDANN